MASLEEKTAQTVFPGFWFGRDDQRDALSLVKLGVGGFCLYGGKPHEVARFTSRLQKAARIPLLFSGDYEDGIPSQCSGGTRLSSNMGLGAAGSLQLAWEKGRVTAREARAIGVQWVFAPVVDLANEPLNPIVNIRSFSDDPRAVIRLARAYMRGLHDGGALSCLKHFPGHGDTRRDSHLELPRVRVSRSVLSRRELVPFKSLAAAADSIMTAHLSVPALEEDSGLPVSLSAAMVRGPLRRGLGFRGLVSTDALSMKAVAIPEIRAGAMALLADSDVLLVPNHPRELIAGLQEKVRREPALAAAVEKAFKRLSRAKKSRTFLSRPPGFGIVASAAHERVTERMAEKCLAWSDPRAGAKVLRSLTNHLTYLEPGISDPTRWRGRIFVSALRSLGFIVRPFDPRRREGTLVVGSFLSPRAFSGKIAYPDKVIGRVNGVIKGSRVVVAAFGSPFVLEHLKGWDAGLCAFSVDASAQRAAAGALAGRLPVRGRMPVRLEKA